MAFYLKLKKMKETINFNVYAVEVEGITFDQKLYLPKDWKDEEKLVRMSDVVEMMKENK